MPNDGENLTLKSLSNEFLTTTIQSAIDCFRLGRTINQFRPLRSASMPSLESIEISELTYSSINLESADKEDNILDELPDADDPNTDDDEDNLICQLNLDAENYRL